MNGDGTFFGFSECAESDGRSELGRGKNGMWRRRYSNDGGTNGGLVTEHAKREPGGENEM